MIRLQKASHRNTQSHWVDVFGVGVLFSYETPIAFRGNGKRLRTPVSHSRTTGRHRNEAGVIAYPIADTEEIFLEELDRALLYAAHPMALTATELEKGDRK
jgi:hypothetical protein